MPYLVAAVAVLTALTLFNLVLMLGVIRRLRDHTDRFAAMTKAVTPDEPILAPGRPVGAFETTAHDGVSVSAELLDGDTLVAFFSPSCAPCKTVVPTFAEYARTRPGGRDRVLAVIATDADPADYLDQLAPVARVVLDEPAGPVASAFAVGGFPSFALLGGDGVVVASGMRLADVTGARTPARRG